MAVGFAIFDKWVIQQDAASVIVIGGTESHTKLFRIVEWHWKSTLSTPFTFHCRASVTKVKRTENIKVEFE